MHVLQTSTRTSAAERVFQNRVGSRTTRSPRGGDGYATRRGTDQLVMVVAAAEAGLHHAGQLHRVVEHRPGRRAIGGDRQLSMFVM